MHYVYIQDKPQDWTGANVLYYCILMNDSIQTRAQKKQF